MRFADGDSGRNLLGIGVGVKRTQNRNLLDDEFKSPTPPTTIYSTTRHEMPPVTHAVAATGSLAGVGAWRKSIPSKAPYNGPFSDYISENPIQRIKPSITGGVGMIIQTERVRDASPRRSSVPRVPPPQASPPSAQSSPSIYPSSIPPGPPELATEGAQQPTSEIPPISIEPPLLLNRQLSSKTNKSDAPKLPPRNPLRNSQKFSSRARAPMLAPQDSQTSRTTDNTSTTYEPLTPPPSSESDTGSNASASSGLSELVPPPPLVVVNPFLDHTAAAMGSRAAFPPPPAVRQRENFYTRRKLLEVRNSQTLPHGNRF